MFQTLLMWLTDPQFWFIVTAVVTGGIIIRALPFLLGLLTYVVLGVIAVGAFIVGIIWGIISGVVALIRNGFIK